MAKRQPVAAQLLPNFVAKHMHEVQRSHVFVDRKKNLKRGYEKHKKGRDSMEDRPFLCAVMECGPCLGIDQTRSFDHIAKAMSFEIVFHPAFYNQRVAHGQHMSQ